MRFLAAVALAAVMLWVPVDGVAQEFRNPLKGLSTTNHGVVLSWQDMIKTSEAVFRQEVEDAFELGLLRTGITLDQDVGGGLRCRVDLFVPPYDEGPYVVVSYRVGYIESVVSLDAVVRFEETLNDDTILEGMLFGETWGLSYLGGVGQDNLSGTHAGEWCAENFELAWRRANN